ncbi:MAG: hypothetical protein K6C95_00925 [Lachnospiraceae bacterium]|nr:hypothetical protein [Lachnospiraceae bacterium]
MEKDGNSENSGVRELAQAGYTTKTGLNGKNSGVRDLMQAGRTPKRAGKSNKRRQNINTCEKAGYGL